MCFVVFVGNGAGIFRSSFRSLDLASSSPPNSAQRGTLPIKINRRIARNPPNVGVAHRKKASDASRPIVFDMPSAAKRGETNLQVRLGRQSNRESGRPFGMGVSFEQQHDAEQMAAAAAMCAFPSGRDTADPPHAARPTLSPILLTPCDSGTVGTISGPGTPPEALSPQHGPEGTSPSAEVAPIILARNLLSASHPEVLAAKAAAMKLLGPRGMQDRLGLSTPAAGIGMGSQLEPGIKKLHRPCSGCRAIKLKCDRGVPCGRCKKLGLVCTVPPSVSLGRPRTHMRMPTTHHNRLPEKILDVMDDAASPTPTPPPPLPPPPPPSLCAADAMPVMLAAPLPVAPAATPMEPSMFAPMVGNAHYLSPDDSFVASGAAAEARLAHAEARLQEARLMKAQLLEARTAEIMVPLGPNANGYAREWQPATPATPAPGQLPLIVPTPLQPQMLQLLQQWQVPMSAPQMLAPFQPSPMGMPPMMQHQIVSLRAQIASAGLHPCA